MKKNFLIAFLCFCLPKNRNDHLECDYTKFLCSFMISINAVLLMFLYQFLFDYLLGIFPLMGGRSLLVVFLLDMVFVVSFYFVILFLLMILDLEKYTSLYFTFLIGISLFVGLFYTLFLESAVLIFCSFYDAFSLEEFSGDILILVLTLFFPFGIWLFASLTYMTRRTLKIDLFQTIFLLFVIWTYKISFFTLVAPKVSWWNLF